jgi:endonuclease-3
VKTNWNTVIQPLLKKYRRKQHPLDFKNRYQLLVMVILSAQSTDKLINDISVKLFETYPTLESLGRATVEDLRPLIGKVRSFYKKAGWLIRIGQQLREEKNIPLTMDELVKLPGIGRKSANVILREAKMPAVGVVVDLHVLRVAPRIGIAKGTDPKKMEQQLMKNTEQKYWAELGMALSFLGRETCRPTDPHCAGCVLNADCAWYLRKQRSRPRPAARKAR